MSNAVTVGKKRRRSGNTEEKEKPTADEEKEEEPTTDVEGSESNTDDDADARHKPSEKKQKEERRMKKEDEEEEERGSRRRRRRRKKEKKKRKKKLPISTYTNSRSTAPAAAMLHETSYRHVRIRSNTRLRNPDTVSPPLSHQQMLSPAWLQAIENLQKFLTSKDFDVKKDF